MKASCPACGSRFDLECAVSDADGRRFMATLAELPAAIGPLMIQYLGLFRPEGGGLRYSRMLALAEELKPLIAEGRVIRAGRTWPAPNSVWVEAMQHLASRPASLRLPLKTNGYLFEIVGAMGEGLAAKHEKAHEENLKHGHRDGESAAGPRTEPTRVSSIIANMKKTVGAGAA